MDICWVMLNIEMAIESINVTDLAGYTAEEMGAFGTVRASAILDNGWKVPYSATYRTWESAFDAWDSCGSVETWGLDHMVACHVSEISAILWDNAVEESDVDDTYRDRLDADIARAIQACDNFF